MSRRYKLYQTCYWPDALDLVLESHTGIPLKLLSFQVGKGGDLTKFPEQSVNLIQLQVSVPQNQWMLFIVQCVQHHVETFKWSSERDLLERPI
jgi:hypothetical protein